MKALNEFNISIIIPTRNEAANLPKILLLLQTISGKQSVREIIISDGNSTDQTIPIAESFGSKVVKNETPGRARQMNAGAAIAMGDVLYFLHADTIPPEQFVALIQEKMEKGYDSGCFRLRFDMDHWFLKLNAWFTRFNVNAFRFGDQSLFVKKDIFLTVGGFREDLMIMEDQEIIYRISKKTKFGVIRDYVTTSARKYQVNGIFRMQFIFFYIYFAYQFGMSQQKLVAIYKKWIRT